MAGSIQFAKPIELVALELTLELTLEVELKLDLLDDEELRELDFRLEDEELTIELELDLILDELLPIERDETPHPATTPKGAGWVMQVEAAMQLLPFS
jgi:hypothetical protein